MLFLLEKIIVYLVLFGLVIVFAGSAMLVKPTQTRSWQFKALCLESIGSIFVLGGIACFAFYMIYGYHLHIQSVLTILLMPATLWFSVSCIIYQNILRFRGKTAKLNWCVLTFCFAALYMIGFVIVR
mgnify:FL=1